MAVLVVLLARKMDVKVAEAGDLGIETRLGQTTARKVAEATIEDAR